MRVELGLRRRGLLAQFAALIFASFALGGILGLADRFRDFVRLAIDLIDFGLLLAPLGFESQEAIDVGLRAAQRTILSNQVDVFDDKFAIEHAEKRRVRSGE